MKIFNDVIKYGIIIDNFNISLIHPIPKKKIGASYPNDYRPISVSSTFCNIYESLILDNIIGVFKFI